MPVCICHLRLEVRDEQLVKRTTEICTFFNKIELKVNEQLEWEKTVADALTIGFKRTTDTYSADAQAGTDIASAEADTETS